MNTPKSQWFAIVLLDGDRTDGPHYVRRPFAQEPEPGAASVNYRIDNLPARAERH